MAIKISSMRSPLQHTVRPGTADRMSLAAPRHARSRGFGRGRVWNTGTVACEERGGGISQDLQLFGMTFAAGFVFVSVLIG